MPRHRWTPQPRPPLENGDRLFIRCAGGPTSTRLVTFPPPVEIEERGGMYVLNDDHANHDHWVYEFVASEL